MKEEMAAGQNNVQKGTRVSTNTIVITGLSIALVLVATAFVNVRLPLMGQGGLIHLGNVPLFLVAIIYGRKIGALAGAFGMGLFDLLSGWTAWAPFTFVIVGLMGYTIGWIAERHAQIGFYALALLLACGIKVTGYYFAEVILFGNWIVPLSSIPGNLVQVGVAAVLVLPIAGRLRSALRRDEA